MKIVGRLEQWNSAQRSEILNRFSIGHVDTTRSGANYGDRFPFDIIERMNYVLRMCHHGHADAVGLLEEPLQLIEAIANSAQNSGSLDTKALLSVAAFAHCAFAQVVDILIRNARGLTISCCTECWRRTAAKLDSAVYEAECGLDHTLLH